MKPLRTIFNNWAAHAKNDYLGKQWLLSKWEMHDGIDWPLDKVNILLESVREVMQVSPSDSLIDIGCGGGWIWRGLQNYVKWSAGLDISEEMLKNVLKTDGH